MGIMLWGDLLKESDKILDFYVIFEFFRTCFSLKTINIHELKQHERQLAVNESKVLALLDHPNIMRKF